MLSGRRKLLYSMIEIWIAAATGMASSAPSTPNSVEPKSTEVSTTNGATCTALAWIRGWMTLFSTCWYTIDQIVQMIVVVGKSLKSVMMPTRIAPSVAPTSGTRSSRKMITASEPA